MLVDQILNTFCRKRTGGRGLRRTRGLRRWRFTIGQVKMYIILLPLKITTQLNSVNRRRPLLQNRERWPVVDGEGLHKKSGTRKRVLRLDILASLVRWTSDRRPNPHRVLSVTVLWPNLLLRPRSHKWEDLFGEGGEDRPSREVYRRENPRSLTRMERELESTDLHRYWRTMTVTIHDVRQKDLGKVWKYLSDK